MRAVQLPNADSFAWPSPQRRSFPFTFYFFFFLFFSLFFFFLSFSFFRSFFFTFFFLFFFSVSSIFFLSFPYQASFVGGRKKKKKQLEAGNPKSHTPPNPQRAREVQNEKKREFISPPRPLAPQFLNSPSHSHTHSQLDRSSQLPAPSLLRNCVFLDGLLTGRASSLFCLFLNLFQPFLFPGPPLWQPHCPAALPSPPPPSGQPGLCCPRLARLRALCRRYRGCCPHQHPMLALRCCSAPLPTGGRR